MAGVVVVFPNKDNAVNVRNLLTKNGYNVVGTCTTGAQAIQYAEMMGEGIIVCGYKFQDMLYTELREYISPSYEMLLIASSDKLSDEKIDGVVGLSMPIKVYDLLSTMDMMSRTVDRRRKKRKENKGGRSEEQKKLIRDAKALLMERNKMTEDEAHRYLQKCSMDSGTNIVETAEMVLSVMT